MAEEVLVACRCRHGVKISHHCFMVGTIAQKPEIYGWHVCAMGKWAAVAGVGTFPLMVDTFYAAPLKNCYTLWLAPF